MSKIDDKRGWQQWQDRFVSAGLFGDKSSRRSNNYYKIQE